MSTNHVEAVPTLEIQCQNDSLQIEDVTGSDLVGWSLRRIRCRADGPWQNAFGAELKRVPKGSLARLRLALLP